MKKITQYLTFLIAGMFFTSFAFAQTTSKTKNEQIMKTYVIERNIPGAGNFTAEQLKAISQTSCNVLKEMGPAAIIWDHSYVTGDKIFCVYKAQNEELVREHAKKGGFPANNIYEVKNVISPETATAEIR